MKFDLLLIAGLVAGSVDAGAVSETQDFDDLDVGVRNSNTESDSGILVWSPLKLEIVASGVTPSSIGDNSFVPGANVSITCHTSGDSTLKVEWRKAGIPLPSDASPGQAVLHLMNASDVDSGVYVCQAVIPGFGTVLSDRVSLFVLARYAPTSVKVTATGIKSGGGGIPVGGMLSLVCEANGSPAPNYTWSKTSGNESVALPAMAVINGNTLNIASVQPNDAGTYVCTAQNQYGSSTYSAHLAVNTTDGYAPKPLTVTATGSATIAGILTLLCEADGSPTIEYTWSRISGMQSVAFPDNAVINGNKLTFLSIQANDAGTYVCTSQNEHDSASSGVRLIVNTTGDSGNVKLTRLMLEITADGVRPRNVEGNSFVPGTDAAITCRAIGDPTLHLEWRKAGRMMHSDASPGQAVLRLRSLTDKDSGVFECQAFVEGVGVILSGKLSLTVLDGAPTSVTVTATGTMAGGGAIFAGGTLILLCQAKGSPAPTYTWSRTSGNQTVAFPTGAIIHANRLIIPSIQEEDAGTYVCTAKNRLGSSSKGARLIVDTAGGSGTSTSSHLKLEIAARGVRSSSVNNDSFLPGTNVTITCRAIDNPSVVLELRKAGLLLPSDNSPGQAVINLRNVAAQDSGVYVCQAVAVGVRTIKTAELNLTVLGGDAPHSVNLTAAGSSTIGGRINLLCEASGSPPLSYTWSRTNGTQSVPIPAKAIVNGNKLTISSFVEGDAGTYLCTTKNQYGSASRGARIVVGTTGGSMP